MATAYNKSLKYLLTPSLLTPEQTASRLGLNRETLHRHRRNGVGLPFVVIGKRVFYRRKTIFKYAEYRRSLSAPLSPIDLEALSNVRTVIYRISRIRKDPNVHPDTIEMAGRLALMMYVWGEDDELRKAVNSRDGMRLNY